MTRITDPRSNPTDITYTAAGLIATVTDAQNNTTTYAYDARGNRTSVTDALNNATTFTYDAMNRLTRITAPGNVVTEFTYDALSRRTQLARPNNVVTDYAYDNLSRLLSVLHKLGGSTIDGASYTVDAVGNRTSKTNQLNAVIEDYSYDGVGNRLSSLSASPWSYNNSNQLTSIAGSPGTTFTYDNNGNTTGKTDASGTTTYAWDYENRLTQVTLPDQSVVSFTYDPLGRRIRKSSASATTIYAYDGEGIVEETDASGTVVARYAQGLNIDEPLAMLRGSVTSFYQADGLGSITALTDPSGVATDTYTYDTFGNLAASTGSTANPFRYTAREWESEMGLYFYRARYYGQESGRFVSEDPVAFEAGHNFYPYVLNNPENLSNPSGNNPAVPLALACAANPPLCAAVVVTGGAVVAVVVATHPPVQEALNDLARSADRALDQLWDRIKPRAIPLPRETTQDRAKPICSDPKRQEECEEMYEADIAVCRALKSRPCYDQAMQRYAACLAGREIPPFPYRRVN